MDNMPGKSILLHEPLEYLIFNQVPITLIIGESKTQISGHFVDIEGDRLFFYADTPDNSEIPDCIDCEIHASCSYRSKRLEFLLNVVDIDKSKNVIFADIPHQGNLVDERQWERTNFYDSNCADISVELEIETVLGKKHFKSSRLLEFSYESFSFCISRKFGLIVPYDEVENISIKEHDGEIFSGTGKVARIEQFEEENDTYLVVVVFNDPNAKPQYDIEPNKRQSERYIFQNKSDAFIEFVHPFSKSVKMASLHDISNSGISIFMNGGKYAMPPGMVIENVSLQLPMHHRIQTSLRVKGYSKNNDHNNVKINMEFINSTASLIKSVSNFVQNNISEHLQDATYEDVDELWYFYFETGFIYDGKRKQIQANADDVKNTFNNLLKYNTPIVKKILYKEDGVIKGHVTALKVFDKTLMVQHLNALKTNSGPAAMQVIRGITSYFIDRNANKASGSRYICFYYRPDNFYPDLVFGAANRLIEDDNICWIDRYRFCVPDKNNHYHISAYPGIDVYEAKDNDLYDLEKLLVKDNDFKSIRLESLTVETMTNMEITREYENIGLYRYRRIFVSHSKDTDNKVYAVCTYASPGLNFSELTNAIKLFCENMNSDDIQELIDRVSHRALLSYAETKLEDPVLLIKENQPVPACFHVEKNYTLFALDVNYTKMFKVATEHVFSKFKEFIRERKKQAS